MRRFVIAAAVLSFAVADAAFAADSGTAPKGPNMSFEERKAEVLKHIDTRLISLQEEKTCVHTTNSYDELRACKQKHHADMDHMRGEHGKGCGKCGCKDGPCGPGRMPAEQ